MQAVDWVAGDCAKMHTSKAEASRRPAISVCKANLACGEAEDLGQNDTLQQLAEAAKQRGNVLFQQAQFQQAISLYSVSRFILPLSPWRTVFIQIM